MLMFELTDLLVVVGSLGSRREVPGHCGELPSALGEPPRAASGLFKGRGLRARTASLEDSISFGILILQGSPQVTPFPRVLPDSSL